MKGYKPHVVRDQIRFISNLPRLRRAVFALLDRLQSFTPGEQVVGTAVALIATCQSANISLDDVITTARNVLAAAEKADDGHLGALRDFAANEIARGEEYRA